MVKRIVKETEAADGVVDFTGNEKSMAFAVAAVARGGKTCPGLMGGNFSLPMVMGHKAHDHRGLHGRDFRRRPGTGRWRVPARSSRRR
jgi:hypothetical protein